MIRLSCTLILLSLLPVAAVAQDQVVRGTVTDTEGEPLPGVTIRQSASSVGTVTNADGTYAIRPTANPVTLYYTFIGMQRAEYRWTGEATVDIALQEEATQLDNVVVTAYDQRVTRDKLVGAVSSVSAEELQNQRPVESVDRMLEGKVAGVEIQGTGRPGGQVSVNIRGQGTLPTNNQVATGSSGQPLYIIDGVPLYDNSYQAQPGLDESVGGLGSSVSRLNPLASINPDDIESISVLKDASAAAIYGANAAHGVIIITTKSGREGPMQVDLTLSSGITQAVPFQRLLNTPQYVELYEETLRNSGRSQATIDAAITDRETNTAWEKVALRTGTFRDARLSIAGGTKKVGYRVSFNANNQQTEQPGNDFARYAARINTSFQLTPKLKLTYMQSLGYNDKNDINVFGGALLPPNLSPYDEDGQPSSGGLFENIINPVAVVEQNENNVRVLNTTASTGLSYQLLEGLSVSTRFGIDYYSSSARRFDSRLNATGFRANGRLRQEESNNVQWVHNTQVNHLLNIGERHSINSLVGYELRDQIGTFLRGTASDFPFDGLRTLDAAVTSQSRSARDENAITSLFFQVGYTFDDRHIINLNGRRDNSSVFGGDVNRGDFGSVGYSWVISNEAFYDVSFLNLAKVRATYGVTGNSRIGSFRARGLYNIDTDYYYGGNFGLIASEIANEELSWEQAVKIDLGLDLKFWNRLDVTVDYYRNTITNAIGSSNVPNETGFTSVVANYADLRNQGWEVSASGRPVQRAVTWFTSLNYARNRNEILDLYVLDQLNSTSQTFFFREGQDSRTIWGVNYVGADPATGRAIYQLPDGSLTDSRALVRQPENLAPIGTAAPLAQGGWTNRLSWKNFELAVFGTYSFGSDFLVDPLLNTGGQQIDFRNQSINQLDRWQQPGDIAVTPRLHESTIPLTNSTQLLFNNDFITIRNVSLTYQMPEEVLARWRMRHLGFSFQVDNIGELHFSTTPSNLDGPRRLREAFPQNRTYVLTVTAGI